ncbi:unnamed protein product [Phytophthora fragariaefolia]|uniref:Unnamed protein product n=1 Tax=Phytophthora fragariaefolia TaxID=1490495 RepID=A0A9W6UD39_9STRA|nr:unnamed protein product [Phytophthora fragariaefolia]
MEVSSLKSSGTASIRTPVQARPPPVLSAEVQVKVFVADQVRRWERDVSKKSFPPNIKYDWPHDHLDSSSYLSAVLTTSDWTAVTIPVAHFSPRECVAVLQTQLFEAGFGFLNWVPGWFWTRANKAHPDLVRNVVEEMLILLTIDMVELRQLLVRAAEIQVSARAEQPRPEGVVLEPDVEMSDREVELLGRDYARMLKVSGLQKPRSPRGPSVGEPGPKRIQRVPALAPPSSIPTSEPSPSMSSSAFRSLEGAPPGTDLKPDDGSRSHPDVGSSAQVRRHPVAQAAKRVIDAAGPVDAPRPNAPTARDDHVPPQLNARLDLEVARRFGPRAQGASEKLEDVPSRTDNARVHRETEKLEDVPSQTDNARVHRETETQKAARLEAVRLERERADTRLAQYRAQTEAHQAEEARRVTTMVEAMQQELEDMRVERTRERETAKNVQTFLREQLRNIRTTSVQTTPRPVTPNLIWRSVARTGSQNPVAPANAKSAERKGRDALSKNNKLKKTPKHRGSSDNSDSDSSSGSSDQASDRSYSSSFEDVVPNVPTVTGPGGTMFTFRPYVNASALEDFDEKASLAVRTRWLKRFQSIAVQGGWTDKVKLYEMKLKLSAAVRNWRANLRPKVRRDWKKFLKAFREMYCKAKTSDSERYYTMMQRKSESPLEFYYCLNKVADKAGIDFHSSFKQRERHLKVFTKKLLDSRLRTTSRPTHPEVTRSGPKRSGRAYVIQDEDSPGEDEDDREVRFQDVEEEVPNVPSTVSPAAESAQPGNDSGKDGSQAQDISSAVFRIFENSGWRPPPNGEFRPAPRSPRFEDRNRTKFCERCNDFGHSTESCWSDRKCDRCGRKGHPARLCRLRPCSCCKKFHEDQCGEWKKFQAVKTLARQGQRYGWWEEHTSDETKKVAMVHGAVNNCRTDILLDSGASVSVMSLDLALRKCEERLAQLRRESEPPCVRTPEYQWPKKLLVRAPAGSAQVHMVRLQPRPNVGKENSPAKSDVQLSGTEISGTSDSEGTESREAKLIGGTGDSGISGDILEDRGPVVVLDEDSDSDDEAFYDAISFDRDDGDEDSQEDVKAESSTGTCSDRLLLPVRRLEKEYERCMHMSAEELSWEPAVYIHEGSELLMQLRDELAMLPELRELSPECDINKDLDVGDAKPVAQCPRSIAPHLVIKVYELLKKLLKSGLIEHSGSPWASPIVIVLKKNGVDIRMCIDNRVVNGFIQSSNYPQPLIDDLLIVFESAMWFMSLDMASGFWAIRMTERAKLISAFVCPFGHFQWVRMPFGLKNAPLVYQTVINNCLWGFVRLSPEEEVEVDQDVLEFLGLDPSTREDSGSQVSALTDTVTVFQRNIPAPASMGPILGWSSYIDDIAHGAPTWDQQCDDLDALLFRLSYWNLSVSLPTSEFGKLSIPYLSHETSAEGIRAVPKIAKRLQDLQFPKTMKGVQSFLGSLNYYHKFIEDFPVVAAVLYELSDEAASA